MTSIDPAAEQSAIGVNASIAEKRPMRANDVDFVQRTGRTDKAFVIMTALGNDLAAR